MSNILWLRTNCLNIAKNLAPKDTGNLAFNAIKTFPTNNGFRITYLSSVAPYAAIIDAGRTDRPLSAKEKANVGFISNRTVTAVAQFIKAVYTGQNTSFANTKVASDLAKNNPARNEVFLRSLARKE